MLKLVLGHLRGLPGAPKSAKKALCSSGIKGKPDDFFRIPVTPIKIEKGRLNKSDTSIGISSSTPFGISSSTLIGISSSKDAFGGNRN
jgi:hypothetical protein